MATIGRIKFTLKCNYRSKSTSTEYFDLEMIDDNFAKSNQIIDIKPNKEIKGYYMEHKGTIEEKVSIAEKNIDKVKNLIPEVDTVTFQLSLRSGYNQNPDNIIPNISSFLKTKFA